MIPGITWFGLHGHQHPKKMKGPVTNACVVVGRWAQNLKLLYAAGGADRG